MSRLILASKSPRRFELLSMTGLSFEVQDAHVDEDAIVEGILRERAGAGDAAATADSCAGQVVTDGAGEADVPSLPPMYVTAEKICCALASAKAAAVLRKSATDGEVPDPDLLVLGSDTVVVTEDEILGKPKDEDDARRMLAKLSGKTHRVYTGVSIQSKKDDHVFSSFADVKFHDYDAVQKALIESYIASGSPMDKAGAYGIQDTGSLLIDSIIGDYYAVVGLPVAQVYRALRGIMES